VTTTLELPLIGPGGEPIDLRRTLASHGFADLAPMHPDEETGTLDLTLRVPRGSPRRLRIGPGAPGHLRAEIAGRPLAAPTVAAITSGITRVLRLDQDLSGFYELVRDDPDLSWATGGAGRMLASPTVFEDVVKTICTTNCSWSLTTTMVRALVTHLGEPPAGLAHDPATNAFPTPAAMAAQPESFYREVVRAGYRAPFLRTLAAQVAAGDIDLERLAEADPTELPDAELEATLLRLPGVGPYAATHIAMTLGRTSHLILDSWTRPTYARLTGRRAVPADRTIVRRFARYGEHAGLAFWLFLTRDWVPDR